MVRAGLFALLLALAFVARAEEARPEKEFRILDRIVAVVGDEIILESEVERFSGSRIIPKKPDETLAQYRDRVLSELITDLLRERELRSTGGFEPDPREVEKKYEEIARQVEAREGKPYSEVLLSAGVTVGEAKNWVKRALALDTYLRDRLLPRIRITQKDIEEFYEGPFRTEALARGLTAVPPLDTIQDQLVVLVRERRLNAEIERWTEELRQKTRILVYRRGPRSQER